MDGVGYKILADNLLAFKIGCLPSSIFSLSQRKRLLATDSYITEPLCSFHERERLVHQPLAHSSNLMTNVYHSDSYVLQSLYCIHVCFLLSPGEICHGDTEPNVDILSTEPFLVGVYDGTNHGLIKCTRLCGITRYHCSTCPSSNPNCNHLEVFKEWEADDSHPQTSAGIDE